MSRLQLTTLGITTITTALLLTVPAPPITAQESASDLNTRGFQFYKEKQYGAAANWFRMAIEADDTHVKAHYNLACTLALIREKGGDICSTEAYRSAIIYHLKKAVELEPDRRKKMQKDADLNSIRDTFGYQILKGRLLTNTPDVELILIKVTWYGPSPGVYGPVAKLDFREDGSVHRWRLKEESGELVKAGVGTFSVDINRVTVKIDGKTHTGTLSSKGVLEIKTLDGHYTDDPDECGV